MTKFLRIKSVCEAVGLSKSYIYQLLLNKQFPQPIAIIEGGSAKAWIEQEIQEWMEQRIAARDEVA